MEERIMIALTDVRDEFIINALEFLGCSRQKKTRNQFNKKWLRTLLIAAIISLLIISAFAAGLFGLRSFLVPASSPAPIEEPGGYISTNGYMDSPEGKAAAEWAEFCESYDTGSLPAGEVDSWLEADPSNWTLARIYGVYNEAMADKLAEIQEKYGLILHTRDVFPASEEIFYKATGVAPFLLKKQSTFQCHYIFEDGSFKGEGRIDRTGEDIGFTLIRGREGTLAPNANYLIDPHNYTNWQYTTASGDVVDIAMRELRTSTESAPYFLFYTQNGFQITIYGGGQGGSGGAETFADSFDFSALCAGTPNITAVDEIDRADPMDGSEGWLTWEILTQTKEWKAAMEFSAFCAEEPDSDDGKFQARAVYGHGNVRVDVEMEYLHQKYDLQYPTYTEFLANNYGDGRSFPYLSNGIPDGAEYRHISLDEAWALMGNGPLFDREHVPISQWYDTGAFYTGPANTDVYYIPKGVLFTYGIVMYNAFTILDTWQYVTAAGDAVTCVTTNRSVGMILYETENAYVLAINHLTDGAPANLQAAADQIFFSNFR